MPGPASCGGCQPAGGQGRVMEQLAVESGGPQAGVVLLLGGAGCPHICARPEDASLLVDG